MKQTIGFNLQRYRAEREMTQAELASSSGVSLSTVKSLESSKETNPSAKTLGALARTLNHTIADLLTEPMTLEHARFRASSSLRPSARINVVDSCARWLDNYCFIENLLDKAAPFKIPVPFDRQATLAEYAAQTRQALGYGLNEPIHDIASALEKCNVKLWYSSYCSSNDVFGLSMRESPQKTGIVVFYGGKRTTERVIFTTIHEFAHLLLHHSSFCSSITEEDKTEENEADEFAGYFLMPRESFLQYWKSTLGSRFVDRVLRVKRFFRVSYRTVLRRLEDERIVDANVWTIFSSQYNRQKRGDLKNHKEPEPLSPFDAPQCRFERLVYEALEKELITVGRAAEFLRVPVLQVYDTLNQSGGVF